MCNTHNPTNHESIDQSVWNSIEYWYFDAFLLLLLIVCRINLVSWLFALDTISNFGILIGLKLNKLEKTEPKIDYTLYFLGLNVLQSADYNNNNEIWYRFGSTEFSSSL